MDIRKLVATGLARNPNFVWVDGADHCFRKVDFGATNSGAVVAIILDKTADAYDLIASAIVDGLTYVPLNPSWNDSRLQQIVTALCPKFVAVSARQQNDCEWLARLGYTEEFASGVLSENVVVLTRAISLDCAIDHYRQKTGLDDILYVMFTSGSTGVPKGVPVPRRCVDTYVNAMNRTFNFSPGEKFIQAVDLNFDLSVHDMMLAWCNGGSIVAIPAQQTQLGPRFVRKFGVENWLSVPSTAAQSLTLGQLKPGTMPSLRRSFFCGEALPSDIAKAWAAAAINAPVYNLYGPTEATIAATWHQFDPLTNDDLTVPIGRPLEGTYVNIADNGELELGGGQVFAGYLDNPAENASKLRVDDKGITWYNTGDKVDICSAGLKFVGRSDLQTKIKGLRIELEEIEFAMRQATGSGLAFAVPFGQQAAGSFSKLCGFLEANMLKPDLRHILAKNIPSYMIPDIFYELETFPRNANGKVDRRELELIADQKAAVS